MFMNMKISELVEINPKVNISKGKDVPFVEMGDITPGRRYVYSSCLKKYLGGGSKFQAGDVLFARITPCLENGKIAQFKAPEGTQAVGSTEFFVFRGKKGLSDAGFVYYLMLSDAVRLPAIKSMIGASGRQRADINVISNTEVRVPELRVQNKIAAILSAYDDLIENNTRRIKILEEMARLLYREWFMKFRFPGHEKVRMVESELGPIPEGWDVKKVSAIAKIFRGKSYKSSDIANDGEGLLFLNLKCIERDGGFRYDGIKWFSGQYKDTQVAKAGDIIMAVTDMTQERRIVARAARVPRMFNVEKYVFSMDLVKIVPLQDVVNEYLYSVFRYSTFPDKVKQHANGANVLHLNPDHIANFEMLIAPTCLQNKYVNIVKNLYAECDMLQMKNTILRHTRDLLLPKLVSGELDVEDLDINVGGN